MKLLISLLLILNTSLILSQKLPKDALDSNTILIFNPSASVEDNEETLDYFSNKIIESGFNLVGKHLHTTSQVSLKEIEFDMENKNVKYIFLLTYKFFKDADYDLILFENDPKKNPMIMTPNQEIIRLKPGFVHTTDVKGTIVKKLKKEVDNLKAKYKEVDTVAYDSDLFHAIFLTEQNVEYLKELNLKNTLIDGVTLTIEHQNIPSDLKSNKLAIIGMGEEEHLGSKSLNKILKAELKKYPYNYSYFDNYDAYLKSGGDTTFKYRIQLTKSSVSFLSQSQPTYTIRTNYHTGNGNIAHTDIRTSFGKRPVNYQKDLFTVVIKNNDTQERYIVSETNFIARALKNFSAQL